MSVKSSSSIGEACVAGGAIVRAGYLKKLKTSRKKWFVLRAESCESSARLEYYDTEKKFNSGQPPKRSIQLKTCFNINKRSDTKYKHVIALYTKDDCFCVVLDSEEELDAWLKALLSLQHGEEAADGEIPRPTFEHVWQVHVLNRGLGGTGLLGGYPRVPDSSVYRLCLTDKTLSLIRKDCEKPQAELSLSSIRSCGNLKNFFFLEVGRSSSIGAGELWMETEDANIAQNVHQTVYHAMSAKEDLGPEGRHRSSSATESSKPNTINKRQTHGGIPKPMQLNQDTPHSSESLVPPITNSATSTHTSSTVCVVAAIYQLIQRSTSKASKRRHSVSGGVAWPGAVNHQRTQSLPLAHPAPLTDHTSHPPRVAKRPNQSSKCLSAGVRERCDSMPSRPRTTSEGNHAIPFWNQTRPYLAPYRPHSLHGRDISHSPPSGSPVSPPSATCSTDSAGSSLSIDETEPWAENEGRYGHSLTPDEAIAEENCDDCLDSPGLPIGSSPITSNSYVPMAPISSDDGYVDMSPRGRHTNMSPAASVSSVTSGTPSTDMRFAEYPLEKVTSYFTPSEEDETSSAERPIRAYSVGSRQEVYKYKSRIEMSSTPENSRVRAFSVGSKSKKGHSRVLPPHGTHQHPGAKSSSAPILSNSRMQGSHSSIDPMDDLMEMDFSKPANSGYMDMKPGSKTPSGYVEMKPVASRTPDVSSYVDMRPGSSPAKPSYVSPQSDSSIPFIDMFPSSYGYARSNNNINNNTQEGRGDYMDMDQKKSKSIKPSTSPATNHNYIDMNFQPKNLRDLSTSPLKSTFSPKMVQGSPTGYDYMDMDFHPNVAQTPDGYVEMSLGKHKPASHQRQSSLDSVKINTKSDDYANMSGKKKDRKCNKKDKTRSQPIMIQTCSSQFQSKNTNQNSPMYTIGRKHSTGMYLPLMNNNSESVYSSLPRQRSRKNSRKDSKDSSSSSMTTPSSSSTIFPLSLNSPCSPIKPLTVKTSDTAPISIKIPAAIINTKYNNQSKANDSYTVMDFEPKSDYVNYNPAEIKTAPTLNHDESDYAIIMPGVDIKKLNKAMRTTSSPTLVTQLSTIGLNESMAFRPISESKDDFRLGTVSPRPGDLAPKTPGSSKSTENISLEGASVRSTDCVSPVSKILRPSSVNSDSKCTSRPGSICGETKSRPASVSSESTRSSVSRPSSASSEFGSSNSTLVGSRPASVNSDCIRTELHYASLDLAPTGVEDDGNRSPRVKSQTTSNEAGCSNQTPTQGDTGFTYAEIDFIKSEGFKHNPIPNNTRVKH